MSFVAVQGDLRNHVQSSRSSPERQLCFDDQHMKDLYSQSKGSSLI